MAKEKKEVKEETIIIPPEEVAETLRESRKAMIKELSEQTDALPVAPSGKVIQNRR